MAGGAAPEPSLSVRAVRSQLERLLSHEIFARSERLSRFLRYVVEETLAGRGAELKEQVLAAELYGKKTGMEAGDDSTVRVDARRLRDKLREYYIECPRDPVIVSLPKGGYTPVFERSLATPVAVPMMPVAPEQQKRSGVRVVPRTWLAGGAAIVFIAVAGIAVWLSRRTPPPDAWRAVPISLLPGPQSTPSLSPDGNLVAFTWTGGDAAGQTDIYVKAIGEEAQRRLTDTPVSEFSPAWSPDGNHIAFVRAGHGVFTMSQLGGSERRISATGTNPAWAPDSQFLLIRDRVDDGSPGIVSISVRTLERQQLTQPVSGFGDWKAAVSPDGKTLAVIRARRVGVGDVYTVPLSGGAAERRTNWNAAMGAVLWSPDGRELIYNVGYDWPLTLWRVPARGRTPERGRRIELSMSASFPSMSKPRADGSTRLAFSSGFADIGLRLIDLAARRSGELLGGVQPLCDSTIVDYPGAFSPDASRVVFTSARTGRHGPGGIAGAPQLWIANRDGTGLRQLTDVDSPEVRHPAWSRDGRQIAFEASVAGNTDIYVIHPDGGEPRRVTTGESIDRFPNWSGDGRWIYFTSDASGPEQIWKVPVSGGPAVQITQSSGIEPIESLDGKSVYYIGIRAGSPPSLKQVRLESGQDTIVQELVTPSHWAVTARGIFFSRVEGESDALYLLPGNGSQAVLAGRLPFRIARIGDIGRLTVSPDGRWVLTHEIEGGKSNLMLIDGFR